MARVTINVDLKGVRPRTEGMIKLGQYALANQVHADMNPYVPALTYDLRNQSNVTMDNKQVIYNVPYAKKRFYFPARNYTTPGTGPRWDLKAKAIHGGSWANVTKRAMK